MAFKTYLFDMGNVLVHFCHDRMCRQMGALCGQTGPAIRQQIIDTGLQWAFERGDVTPAEYQAGFEKAVGVRVPLDDLMRANADIFTLNTPIVPLLDELKERGSRLVLLSNTSVAHFEFIRREFDVLDRFDDYVLSYEVRALKPEAGIFIAALQAIECAPQECFYTDDIPAYIDAGRRFGFEAEVFTTAEQFVEQQRRRGIRLGRGPHFFRRASA